MIARRTGAAALLAGVLMGIGPAVGTAQAATQWSLGQWDESWVGEPGDGGLSTVGVDRVGEARVLSFGEGVGSTDERYFSDLHQRTHERIARWSSPETVTQGRLARLNERGNLLVVNQEQAGDGTLTASAQRRRDGALSAPQHLFTLLDGLGSPGLALAISDHDEGVVVATSSTHVVAWSLTRAGAWTDPVELDRGARFSQPRVAINDAGDVVAVWRRAAGGAPTVVSRRRGPGLRWQARRVIGAASGVSVIDVAMSPIGTALAVWSGTTGRATGAALPLAGRAWRRTALNRAGERLSSNGLGVDGAGRGLTVLSDFSGAALDATYTPGAGWRRVGGKRSGRGCTPLSTTAVGTALCTYFRGGGRPVSGVFATRRSATGRWSAPERIAPLPENFGGMLNGFNGAGDAVAAWSTQHSNGAIGGQTAYSGRRTPTRLKSVFFPTGRRERAVSAVRLGINAFQIGSSTRSALIQVRRPGARRPLAGAIVILDHGANRLPLPAALRRVMTRRGEYEISVRTGARSFGASAERRATLVITG